MRVLYLIQTFDNLPQIQRLVATILASDPNGHVIVSHNCDGFVLGADALAGQDRVDVMNMPGGNRVDFFQVEGYLKALALARRHATAYDWVVNLTGQCYPVRPLGGFGEHLAAGGADAYILCREVFAETGRLWPLEEAHARYNYRYHWRLTRHELPRWAHLVTSVVREIVNRTQPWVRMDTAYALQIGLRHAKPYLPEGWRLHGGFYFMAISRRAADKLLDFSLERPDVMRHFRLMNLSSEVYAHTVLANDPTIRLRDEVPLYVDYSHSPRGRPRVLTVADIESLEHSGYYFARKFVLQDDDEVFNALDRRVLQPAAAGARLAA